MTKRFDKDKFDRLSRDAKFDKSGDTLSYIIIILAALFVLGTLIRFIFF